MAFMKRGTERGLTHGEEAMVIKLFQRSVNTKKIKVSTKQILWSIPGEGWAIGAFNTLRFGPGIDVPDDYSKASNGDKHFFIHELTHIWQAQNGFPVLWESGFGLKSIELSKTGGYSYTLLDMNNFGSDYNYEQQACILADYFLLNEFGEDGFNERNNTPGDLLNVYKTVLSDFLKDPFNHSNLPRTTSQEAQKLLKHPVPTVRRYI